MAKRAYVLGVSAVALIASVALASAGGFALREQSAYGQGSSFAGAAAPGEGISSMFWNPAAVTNNDGWIYNESHHSFILPTAELDVDYGRTTTDDILGITGNGGDVGLDAWVPSGYFSYNVNDQIYLGVSVNGAFGLATRSERPWVGQFDHGSAKVFSTNVAPTVGYKVNDQLSVAVGAQIQYFKVTVDSVTSAAGNYQRLEGDDIGFGFTAGLTYEPFEGTTIGLGYRSRIEHNLEGTQFLDVVPVTARIAADVTLPDMVTLGVRQRITESFTMMAGVEWANWSNLGTIPIQGSPVPGGAALTFEYEDGWYFSMGGEYQFNDALTLRAGLGYELSPVPDEHRSMRLPDNDRLWASAGLSYAVNEHLSIDAAYTHLFVKDAPVLQTTGPFTYAGTADADVDIFSFSLRYKM